jgi:hypothetical protein
VYRQILIAAKLKTEINVKNRTEWEKSIKEEKFHTRRRRRRRRNLIS